MSTIAATSRSEEDTFALGRALGEALQAGQTVALVGALGAGKTRLVKGIAAGNLPDNAPAVTSPTFVLVHEYPGRVPLYHLDAYRLEHAGGWASLGVDEMLTRGAVVVEWADRVVDLLSPDRVTITLTHSGPTERKLELRSRGVVADALAHRLGKPWR